MISFRTHLVTLVAVFLALAVGVVLGGGPLSELGRGSEKDTSELERRATSAERISAFGEDFASDAGQLLLAAKLKDRDVALVTMPGAKTSTVEGLTGLVEQAGGTVTAVQQVGSSLVNPGEKSLVDTLGSQLMSQLPAGSITATASTYERAGELLASTVATTVPAGDLATDQTRAVADGLKGANLVPSVVEAQGRAPLVLVVLGDDVTGDGADEIVGGIVRGIATRSVGTVVAAPTAATDGQVDRLREAEGWGDATVVDGAESNVGRVSAVAGLVRVLSTTGGNFGATGSDGTLPLG